jgi:hypothetical protein
VIGTNGDASVGSATSGDDVFVLATHGTASLGSATLTGGADGGQLRLRRQPGRRRQRQVVRVESVDLDAKLGLGPARHRRHHGHRARPARTPSSTCARTRPAPSRSIASRDATLRAPTGQAGHHLGRPRPDASPPPSGDLTLTPGLVATRNISISAGGALKVDDVRADAGSVLLSGATVSAGAVSASEDLTLKATSGGRHHDQLQGRPRPDRAGLDAEPRLGRQHRSA